MKTECTSRLRLLNSRVLIGFALYAVGLVLALASMSSAVAGDNVAAELSSSIPAQATGGMWTATGDLGAPRSGHTATLLPNDLVLVAGGSRIGEDNARLASAQLYHPAIGRWQRIADMNHTHFGHTATLLPNGEVLVAGGVGCNGAGSLGHCGPSELYDPTTRTWKDTGSLNAARYDHTATLLPNGQVVVAGGRNNQIDFASAELYDPATGVWTATRSMTTERFSHTATLLPNGQVLVTGGFMFNVGTLASAELYDPATGMWRATGSMNTPRWVHTATLLPNGQVLVAGGIVELFSTYTATAELYDPATGVWTATGSMTTKRGLQTATVLPNGQVLVAGGRDGDTFFTSAELYDPATGMWTATGSMATPRFIHTATLLPDGQVLVAGGDDFTDGSLASAELYESATGMVDFQ
jgi:WD40 repeat protein